MESDTIRQRIATIGSHAAFVADGWIRRQRFHCAEEPGLRLASPAGRRGLSVSPPFQAAPAPLKRTRDFRAAVFAFLPDRARARIGRALSIFLRMRVTAFCPCRRCCGEWADGITASGEPVTANGGRFCAADPAIAFHAWIRIPGYNAGGAVPVLDRGDRIRGDRLDVFFPTHAEALEWGVRWLEVEILPQPASPRLRRPRRSQRKGV